MGPVDVNHEALRNLKNSRKLTVPAMAEIAGVGEDQMRNILSGENDTSLDVVKRLATHFGVPLASLILGGGAKITRASWRLNTRKGLRDDGAPLEGDDFAPFQNFLEDKKGNRFAIAYLWTELTDDWIHVKPGKGGPKDLGDVLRVHYSFSGKATVPNFGIHPQSLLPRRRRIEQRYFCFQARYTNTDAAEGLAPVVGIRFGDANHFQWEFRDGDAEHYFPLTKSFRTIRVCLTEPQSWHLKGPAVNVRRGPDFAMLTTVVFDCGHGDNFNIGASGESQIELKNLCLASKPDFEPVLEGRAKREQYSLTSSQ